MALKMIEVSLQSGCQNSTRVSLHQCKHCYTSTLIWIIMILIIVQCLHHCHYS